MSITKKRTNASVDAIWSVLSDPKTYEHWVVGAKEIRSVSGEWPQPDARLHHSVGVGPVVNKDDTVSLEVSAPHHIKLLAKARPFGVAEVTIDLTDDDDRTLITMQEDLLDGLVAHLPRKLLDLGLHPRNVQTLERLVDLAESR